MTELSTELLIARGKYATLRAEYREAAARMTKFGQYATTAISTIASDAQSGYRDAAYFETAFGHVSRFMDAAEEVSSLHCQLEILKPEAWPGE